MYQFRCFFALKTETEPVSETLCFFKKLGDGQVLKKNIMSVNFTCPLFLDFLALECGTGRFSQNIGKELPPDAV